MDGDGTKRRGKLGLPRILIPEGALTGPGGGSTIQWFAALPFLSILFSGGCLDPGTSTDYASLEQSFDVGGANPEVEINLRVDENSTISYGWSTGAGVSVYFDVHTHRLFKVQYFEQGHYSNRSGRVDFVRPGVVSFFWSDATEPTRISVSLEGHFTVDSIYEPGTRAGSATSYPNVSTSTG